MSPLGNFLDDVSLLPDVENNTEDEKDGERRLVVNLMTIHASKGMEFDCVFLVGNEEGTIPTQRSISEGEGSIELDEERRLCYVAMTRAKTYLIMTWRREVQTFFGQGFRFSHPERSRFLDRLASKKKKSNSNTATKKKSYNDYNGTRRGVTSGPRRGIHGSTRRERMVNTRMNESLDFREQPPIKKKMKKIKARMNESLDFREQPPIKKKMKKIKKKKKVIRTNSKKTSSDSPPLSMDSTMFYPVGSIVRHPIHGEGTVIKPEPMAPGDKMMVAINFDSGVQVEFPVEKNGLVKKHNTTF